MTKVTVKALSLLAGLVGGVLAGAIFKQVWKLARGEDEAPDATDTNRGWGEILLAGAIQGAISGVVRATLDRGTAMSTGKLTDGRADDRDR